jgi:hypothetical protein
VLGTAHRVAHLAGEGLFSSRKSQNRSEHNQRRTGTTKTPSHASSPVRNLLLLQ